MCIIAYIPAGTQISEEMMKINFKNNPDGAGMMWKKGADKMVHIKKGYKTVEDLMNDYYKIPVEFERAVHFRIATSGKIGSATCHPFPVRKNVEDMKKDSDTTNVALMHNGVISFCTPKGGMSATFSDTMVFASKFLFPLRGMLNSKALQELIEHADSSRFLIFSKENTPILLGKWEEKDGIMYSNSTFKYEKRNYTCYDSDWYKNYTKKYPYLNDDEYYFGETGGKSLATTSTTKWNSNKKPLKGTDLVITVNADTSQMDLETRGRVAESIAKVLVMNACVPSPSWRATPEGLKFKVRYLPYKKDLKGGTICGYKWDYNYERTFR